MSAILFFARRRDAGVFSTGWAVDRRNFAPQISSETFLARRMME
jgi:hypothetical protein